MSLVVSFVKPLFRDYGVDMHQTVKHLTRFGILGNVKLATVEFNILAHFVMKTYP